MIIVCQTCTARIQIDDAKVPAGSFNVRCPKCNAINSAVANSSAQKSALSVGKSPSTDHPRYEKPKMAAAFGSPAAGGEESGTSAAVELARVLAELLDQNRVAGDAHRERPSTGRRRALVCTAESRREGIARRLVENGYQVFVAEDTRQAVERMRENQLQVVLLDPEFDPAEQGAAFVTREVNVLRPAQRRRVFFGLLSPSFRTLDAHAAFLHNANITVNLNDLDQLPTVLDAAIRDYNELYNDFYRVLNLPAL